MYPPLRIRRGGATTVDSADTGVGRFFIATRQFLARLCSPEVDPEHPAHRPGGSATLERSLPGGATPATRRAGAYLNMTMDEGEETRSARAYRGNYDRLPR